MCRRQKYLIEVNFGDTNVSSNEAKRALKETMWYSKLLIFYKFSFFFLLVQPDWLLATNLG